MHVKHLSDSEKLSSHYPQYTYLLQLLSRAESSPVGNNASVQTLTPHGLTPSVAQCAHPSVKRRDLGEGREREAQVAISIILAW